MASVNPVSTREPLTRERVLAAALDVIDRDGLDAFTMRRLGAELGVEAMAVYRHVPGKAAVLDGVIEAMLAELNDVEPAPGDWRDALRALALRHRALERRHPGAYPLFARMPAAAYAAARRTVAGIFDTLGAAGFSPADAARALRLVVRFTIGFALTRPVEGADVPAGDPLATLLRRLADPAEEDVLFETGLTALLDGLAGS